jgi:hypothetical protein
MFREKILRKFLNKKAPKEKLFGDTIEPDCEYCANFTVRGEKRACKYGMDSADPSHCSRFQYDPLRRTPCCFSPLKKQNPDDFKL